jgi:hypothetical protein
MQHIFCFSFPDAVSQSNGSRDRDSQKLQTFPVSYFIQTPKTKTNLNKIPIPIYTNPSITKIGKKISPNQNNNWLLFYY